MEKITQKGMSNTALKMFALAAMLLDHIHYIFAFTGKIPGWFPLVGRLSAPIFLFCLSEGFAHTRNRKKYFLNIYLLSAGMGILRYLMQWGGILVRPDGFYPQNAMLSSFVILLIIWQGMDWIKEKNYLQGIAAVVLPLIWPFLAALLNSSFIKLAPVLGMSSYSLLPAWGINGSPDCGLPIILTGILLYVLRRKRTWQILGFAGFSFLYYFVFSGIMVSKAVPDFAWIQMFTMYQEWFCMFAAVPMLLYNGKRGAGIKKLFYVFYPAHIYILYALSWLLLVVTG